MRNCVPLRVGQWLPLFGHDSVVWRPQSWHDSQALSIPQHILNISSNRIESIPLSIEGLVNLEDFDLTENPIEDIPLSIANLPKLKSLDYDVEVLFESSLFKHYGLAEIARLLQSRNRNNIKVGILKLPELLRTAFQRYFAAFDDFWKDVTNKEINFKVNKYPEGLEIEVELQDNISREEVELRLNQYFSLLSIKKQEFSNYINELVIENKNLNEKVIRAEVRVSQLEQDIRIIEFQNKDLANSVKNLINNLEGKKFSIIRLESENKTLREFKEDHIDLLKLALPSPNINISQIQEVNQNISLQLAINISQVQDGFSDLIEHLPDELKKPAEHISESLDSKADIIRARDDTSLKTKFRRFFKDLSKVENLKKWIENINSLGKSAPKAFGNIKKALQGLLDYSRSVSMTEASEYIKSLLESIEKHI